MSKYKSHIATASIKGFILGFIAIPEDICTSLIVSGI